MPGKRKKKSIDRRSAGGIRVRRSADGVSYELLFPPAVRGRAEDLEEVHRMLEAGETEIAVDELRWLLDGCRELLEAHKLLGEIAMAEGQLSLAQGHLGYAFELGLEAIPGKGLSGPLPLANPANRAFHEAGRGLIEVLKRLGESEKAGEVAQRLIELDPTDPLEVGKLIRED